ncbi:hypothetical protein [Mycolicibacterium austroafricanum]|uniref:hypothetical protein n=1 Tax=Mycolicibacterium austroafricanum TaxID=39687 RepID=UPI001CA34CC8|nr:hypothetical protein [Mycolicibacterium austroafricanum]QZT57198.1 hypothetical protein JN084_00745 [Mycolicibacterium austroafricanum]
MKRHTLLKRATAAALLSAALATPAGIELNAGTASARPIENTVGGNCGASGGAWQSFWAAGSYIGGTCTYNNNTRYSFDSKDIQYMEERRVKGEWTVVWTGN